MKTQHSTISGLNDEEVLASRRKNGNNDVHYKEENTFFQALKKLVKEPMILLLLLATFIYLINNNIGDAVFLLFAILIISTISLYQDARSRTALKNLKLYAQPTCKVIRNTIVTEIKSVELVIDDYMVIEEGNSIPADGQIIQANDFSINEAVLTGESLPVYKDLSPENDLVYQGTLVVSGLAIAKVTAIGDQTKFGKIGKSLEAIKEEKTPLEIQINNFVKKMVIAGTVIFVITWIFHYLQSFKIVKSLLESLTLAMSILPEEIPVAFVTFMAIGAQRLMKMGIIVKQMKTVETLGSATVICIDKTGTITENRMSLAKIFTLSSKKIRTPETLNEEADKNLVSTAMWASEPIPFDPMEVALHKAYTNLSVTDERSLYKMIHEYPLEGKPPMMTHIFEDTSGKRIIAAKGAIEALISVSDLTENERKEIDSAAKNLSADGYRLLGVAEAAYTGNQFPENQREFKFTFKGIVAFYDPPKENIRSVLQAFYKAGITVKIITGDNPQTTSAIAKQIGFKGYENSMSGDELLKLNEKELKEKISNYQLFTRMFPEAKLRIINAYKANGEIVAMTGDGVNDAPALKSAHIGIAMQKKGTEIAKQAASLILLEDDLSKMVDAIAMGRKIYGNLKKAIQYIVSIHLPIIFIVFIPVALGWKYTSLFSPIHIIFFELIMGPTCSIVYENEPIEQNAMLQKPRCFTTTFFNWKELTTSIVQGMIITIGALMVYQHAVAQEYTEAITRTMIFTFLISANIFLTMVNRSFYYSILTTLRYKNKLFVLIIIASILITAALLLIPPLTTFFEFESLVPFQLIISIAMGFLSVIWFESIKAYKRRNSII